MALFRRLSLRSRLALLSGAGGFVVLAVAALLMYWALSEELSDAITDELTVRVDDLALDLRDGEVSPGSGLVTIQVVSRDGTVTHPTGGEPLLTADELADATSGQIVIDRAVPAVGDNARLLARPVGGAGADLLVGIAATSTAPLQRADERLVLVLWVAGPILIAAIAGAAWILTGAALRPVRRMANEAATISAADTGRRLPHPPEHDEIAELGRTLNAMLARIDSAVTRERAFIDNAAHELRTPIAVLRGELELAAQEPDDAESVAQSLASALEETDRLSRVTDGLLTLARADAGQLIAGDATTELLATARDGVRRLPHRDGVSIEVRGEPTLVRGDPEWVGQIVSNLVVNAERYAQAQILVSVAPRDGYGQLVVADDGPGFPPDLLPRAFDRFARAGGAGRHEGGSAGLGLAIVSSLIQAVGGAVTANNGAPLGGARVVADLPLADS